MLQVLFLVNSLLWQKGISYGSSLIGYNVVLALTVAFLILIGMPGKKISVVNLYVLLFVFIYAVPVTLIGPCKSGIARAIESGCVFSLFFLAAFEVGRTARLSEWGKLETTAIAVLLVGIFSVFVEYTFPQLFPGSAGYRSLNKYSGIFIEPSKLALSMLPSLIILLRSTSRMHVRIGIGALIFFLIATRTATLVGIFLLCILYSMIFLWSSRKNIKVLFLIGFVASGIMALNAFSFFNPITKRVEGITKGKASSTVSTLVYLAGAIDAEKNLLRTKGLGTGFNTMGSAPLPENPVRENPVVGNLNLMDGSFLLSKLVSEFGIFGIVILIIIYLRLRAFSGQQDMLILGDNRKAMNVISSLLLVFLAGSVIRATGYFQGSVFLAITALGATCKSAGYREIGLIRTSFIREKLNQMMKTS